MISFKDQYDAIVIGAGPAGSTTGALLAEKGHDVLIVEKEKFPRYHVGESLMPFCYYSLERLGLIEKLHQSKNPRKFCVQFVRQNGSVSQPFYFFQHMDHPSSTTWQVWRSEFDEMLLDKARENGSSVLEETKAKALLKEDGRVVGVRAQSSEFGELELHAPLVVDASGRDCFAAIREQWMERDPKLKKIAIWTYFKGAKRDPGLDEGATTVAYLPNKGWFWYIPLSGDMVSVGIVAEHDYLFDGSTKDLAEIFNREVKNNLWIEEHLAEGKQEGEYRVTGEFSYRNKFCAIDGLVLAGDALGFLDPVFSSGVFLALKSGVMLADAADGALRKGDLSAATFEQYGKSMRDSIETMRKIVYAFYDEDFSFKDLVMKGDDMRSDLTDCLVGNVDDNDFESLFAAMSKLAELPEPIEHGLAKLGP
ncbi:MAG: FAD-binding protein [Opitutae bacterium]|nr:FAD-binding protein [Opitutae bacterium]MBT5909144.1 FAD-binding protein [Opitutae bacterium]MBT6850654.1 FAD-binding protein [Opitutae bacterium]MBT7740867.1 FAD-binding protein [Opitutae bacterium]